jgi:hypothetical protein
MQGELQLPGCAIETREGIDHLEGVLLRMDDHLECMMQPRRCRQGQAQ